MSEALQIARTVQEAVAAGQPVVALESVVVAHGLPWPENLEALAEMQARVREAGAEPAVIGITSHRLVVGLDGESLERFARQGHGVRKVSRRDVAPVLASGEDGATTVAATMLAAARAGLRVLATGGIGGVHRSPNEGDAGFDVSADLYELARTPLAVVASGAKSILDLPRTLEMLESLGVPVIGYGTRHFPTFYARDGKLPLRYSLASPAEAARLLELHSHLGLGGMLIANPVPEAAAIPTAEIEVWMRQALQAAQEAGIRGAEVTPYLLAQLHQRSQGRTLAANRALLVANAGRAAEIARALAEPRP